MIAAQTISSMARKGFAIGILAYIIAGGGFYVFISREFGVGAAIFLSLLLVCPVIAAVRMYCRWPAISAREYVYFFVLLIVALGGVGITVRHYYDKGMDLIHAEDMRYDDLARAAHADPAFRQIEFSTTELKIRYKIYGTVTTRADLERLQSLCKQFGFAAKGDNIIVANEDTTTEP